MKLLSVDPGSARVGYAVFDDEELIVLNTFEFKSEAKKVGDKNNDLFEQLAVAFLDLIYYHEVTHLAIEQVPPSGQFGSSDAVHATSTLLKTIAFMMKIEWQDIHASTVKLKGTGNGRASKEDVRAKVFDLYPEVSKMETKRRSVFPFDAFDAVLIGHVVRDQVKSWRKIPSSEYTGRPW